MERIASIVDYIVGGIGVEKTVSNFGYSNIGLGIVCVV